MMTIRQLLALDFVVAVARAPAAVAVGLNAMGDFQKLLIDQKTDKFCLQTYPSGLLWFVCGTCRRSQISPCISWNFGYNQAQLISWTPPPIRDPCDLSRETLHPYQTLSSIRPKSLV
uniref:SANT DNA-binding domain-containing protein n=1 Tax=Rhizophora mucronata TaxID=61149 RepID=A0A2P2LR96_RHIMU